MLKVALGEAWLLRVVLLRWLRILLQLAARRRERLLRQLLRRLASVGIGCSIGTNVLFLDIFIG